MNALIERLERARRIAELAGFPNALAASIYRNEGIPAAAQWIAKVSDITEANDDPEKAVEALERTIVTKARALAKERLSRAQELNAKLKDITAALPTSPEPVEATTSSAEPASSEEVVTDDKPPFDVDDDSLSPDR